MKQELAIIGGGPGGYTAALRASQLGIKTILVEKKRVGGVCLNEGCIPTKALLTSAHLMSMIEDSDKFGITVNSYKANWSEIKKFVMETVEKLVSGVEYLLEKSGVTVINGEAVFNDKGQIVVNGETIDAKWKIIATGSRPVELPFLPFDERVLNSTTLMFGEKIPESLVVIGAGAIGLEMASAFSSLGSSVTIIEALPTPLGGNMDRDMAAFLTRTLKEKEIQIFTSTRVEGANVKNETVVLKLSNGKELETEYLLVSIGRKPNSEIARDFIEIDEKGFIKIDENFSTSREGIYAIGDVIGPPLLAHKASHEAIFVVESLAGRKPHRPKYIPYAVFSSPEFAGVGINETEALKSGIKFKKAKFPMKANGRALSLAEENGLVKVLTGENNKILGVQILGPNASEIIAEATLIMEKEGTTEDIANSVHVHPTISETLMEASMAISKKAIHILNR